MAGSSRVQEEMVRVEAAPGSADVQETVQEKAEEFLGKAGSLRLLSLLWQARAQLPLEEIEKLATELESEIETFPEDDIFAIYGAIRILLAEAPTTSSEAEYARLLERLRTLQEAEAEQMTRYFEEHRALREGSGLEALQTAKELLSKHESTATRHAPARRATSETS